MDCVVAVPELAMRRREEAWDGGYPGYDPFG
jgi:hypothetical protein